MTRMTLLVEGPDDSAVVFHLLRRYRLPIAERRFPSHDLRKAMIHTWLAWQREPGRPMGLAITKRFLDPDAPSATAFVAWVRRLFDLPT